MQPHWSLSISWQQVVKLRSEQGRRRKRRRDKGKEEVDKDEEEKKGRSGRKKEWQNWEKQRKEEERKCPQAQSVLSQSSPFPPGWGRTHRTLCRSKAALTASTAQRRHLSFPFKGYQKAQSVAFILSSVLIQCMGITDPRHSTYRSYCSAWHMQCGLSLC